MSAETWTALLANDAVIAMAGRDAFVRAMIYARTGRVSELSFDEDKLTVSGRVRGTYRDAYSTTVQLRDPDAAGPTVHSGRCTCPIGHDCKHAAAVLIAARAQAEITRYLKRPAWEKTLSKLVLAPDPAPPGPVTDLGLEFDVQEIPAYRGYPGRRELRARPVQRGRSGKWIRSGVSWDDLDYVSGTHPDEQRDLLLQIRAATGPTARYTYPRSPWTSLSTVGGSFWSLLRATQRVGLTLVAPGGRPDGVAVLTEPAAVSLDVRRTPGGLLLEPRVAVAGQAWDLAALGLLGQPAHGLFSYVRGAGSGPHRSLSLARLAEPLDAELRQLLLDRHVVEVPQHDEHRVLHEFFPALRRKADVASSDSSVALPEIRGPVLSLRCEFRPEHRLRLDWGWAYAVGDDRRTYRLDEPIERPTLRDAGEEVAVLAGLNLPYDRLPQLADSAAARRGLQPATGPAVSALLEDLQVLYFCEQVLPGLEAAGVEVTVVGDRPDFRRALAPVVELSTTERDDTSDWFDLHISVTVEGEVIPFDTLFVALSRGDDYLVLDTGVYLSLDSEEFVRLRALIEEARAIQEPEADGLRISRFQAGFWEELLQLGVVVEQSDRWAKAVSGLAGVTEIDAVEVPDTLHAQLRPYQVEGYRWLAFLWSHALGGILADDMGLGKTLQALALICRARMEEPREPPFLVVAPTSVTGNWAREAARFAPGLRVAVVSESESKRKAPLAELVSDADLVITSYTLLRLDFAAYDALGWAGMLLDEAQFVKNHRAKTYTCARRLAAPFKLAMTGTPLENNLMELWSLLSITAPGLFPHPERFAEFYRRPIERGQQPELLAQLRRRIRPVMLRRTKDKVATELPPKQEQVIDVVLQPRHQKIYQTHLQRERQKILGLIDDLDTNRFTILSSLTLLRQLSLDASLVDEAYAGVPASKIDVLVEHLDELRQENHRALVFSQFTGFLGRVRERLEAAGIEYAYLDGRTRHRERVIEQFRGGAQPVFLISLKAGGFGLNLTEADYCFLLDPWWNPAAEAQAVDRTHRIGQTKTVMVYRLVAEGTIEEKVMELQRRKTELFGAVLDDDALGQAALSADDIRGLLGA